MLLFSVKYVRQSRFTKPFCSSTTDEAKKMLALAALDSPEVKLFPQDYELYYFGTFNDVDGQIVFDGPSLIGSLKDFVKDFPEIFNAD